MRLEGNTEQQLRESIDYTKQNSMGMEIDMDDRDACRTAMKLCVENDVANGLHQYRFENGPLSLSQLAATDAALYGDLHAYIKHEYQ